MNTSKVTKRHFASDLHRAESLNSSIAVKTINNWQYLNKICAVCGSPAKAKHFGVASCFAW